jgi:hypothetical protein
MSYIERLIDAMERRSTFKIPVSRQKTRWELELEREEERERQKRAEEAKLKAQREAQEKRVDENQRFWKQVEENNAREAENRLLEDSLIGALEGALAEARADPARADEVPMLEGSVKSLRESFGR